MRNIFCILYFININFYENFFLKKTLNFLPFLLEFDLFIDFQTPEVVHAKSRSTLDFCMMDVCE